ncbi:MAG: PAS domain-containing sensor histidine kinase [Alphaproteobacteria bacterium]|nr:PAS domain-containing sensor histidine kinase [Alphaproteobacteria bacterium]
MHTSPVQSDERVHPHGGGPPGAWALWDGKLAILFVALALLAGGATYAALRSAPPFGDNPDAVIWLLTLDLIILCVIGAIIGRRVVGLFKIWRLGIPGARLHVRLVYIFGLLAMAPAVIMTVFSLFFFHYGIQTWFSDRVKTAVNESQEVAESYLREHHQVIRADILAMANDLNHEADLIYSNPAGFARFVQTQSLLRGLSEVVVFTRDHRIIAQAGDTADFKQDEIPQYLLENADDGDVVLLTAPEDDRVQALVRLGNLTDGFLFVGRSVESNVLKHLETTRAAVKKYDEMSNRYLGLQRIVTMIYIVVAMVLLFSAIFFALAFARRLAMPIVELIGAAERVRMGDLSARVVEKSGFEEFDRLAHAFNRMTQQISDQRAELITANRRMDERRQFTETILAAVTSGVLSLDRMGHVSMANQSAAHILHKKHDQILGMAIESLIPGCDPLITAAYARPQRVHQKEIEFQTLEKGRRILLVRIGIELLGERDLGAVITFDDITDVQSAQRKVAWGDVARRIAHEIKNPLTPIQLSAERLKRKYLAQLPPHDQDIFSQCIDTIIRHVGDIGHMVKEFSDFARMPEPTLKPTLIAPLLRETCAFFAGAHSDVIINCLELLPSPHSNPTLTCDEQQVRQALTNLLQNALDSMMEWRDGTDLQTDLPAPMDYHPEIQVTLAITNDSYVTIDSSAAIDERDKGDQNDGAQDTTNTAHSPLKLLIEIRDNGPGFPKGQSPESLSEPYVTFKKKGTGLGLAIVKKIMEDHGGELCFGPLLLPPQSKESAPKPSTPTPHGATITLVFPMA